MAYHDDLLEQAAHLAQRDKNRPKQASLRRSISTSYYSLFHLLISEAVGYWRLERQRSVLARAFDHKKMRGACSRCSAKNVDLKTVATAFVDLQHVRHEADYNNEAVWTRVEAHEHVTSARDAFRRWAIVRKHAAAQDFLLSLFVPERN